MAVAGRVLIVPKGDYNSATVYDVLDLVKHNNRPWLCKKPNTVGIEPTDNNSSYWQLLIDISIADADTLDGYHAVDFAFADDLTDAFATTEVTFAVDQWQGDAAPYTQTVTLEAMTATMSPIPFFIDDGISETESKAKQKAYACITYFDSDTGTITATCQYKKPEATVTVGLKGLV